jgi:hypothetical protein
MEILVGARHGVNRCRGPFSLDTPGRVSHNALAESDMTRTPREEVVLDGPD